MISGTSSSSILTAFLVRPNDNNKNESFYASDAIQLFTNEGKKFFEDRTINYGAVGILVIISALMGLFIGHKIGILIFANPEKL